MIMSWVLDLFPQVNLIGAQFFSQFSVYATSDFVEFCSVKTGETRKGTSFCDCADVDLNNACRIELVYNVSQASDNIVNIGVPANIVSTEDHKYDIWLVVE